MLPDRLIPASFSAGSIAPSYFGSADLPWLNALLEEFNRFCGRPERELEAHLALPAAHSAPPFKLRAATSHLRHLYQPGVASEMKPQLAREALFLAAAASAAPLDRAVVVANTASLHGISPASLEDAIIADLPGERRVQATRRPVTALDLVQAMNDLIVRSLLGRAREIMIRAEGSIRAVFRQAKLMGLLCTLKEDQRGASLLISGPFSLFRHTLLYGRALGSLLGRLPYCARFELTATCQLRGQIGTFVLSSGEGLFQPSPGSEPRAFDSQVEAVFARDLRRLAPGWDLIREPEAIQVGSTILFPDFALVDQVDPRRRYLIEIVGFWTTEYLTRKLAALRALHSHTLIICIDETLGCDDSELPEHAQVVRYRRRVRAEDVLAAIGAGTARPRRRGRVIRPHGKL